MIKNIICKCGKELIGVHHNKKHCDDCGEKLIKKYKSDWRKKNPQYHIEYNKKYLKKWKIELKNAELKLKKECVK